MLYPGSMHILSSTIAIVTGSHANNHVVILYFNNDVLQLRKPCEQGFNNEALQYNVLLLYIYPLQVSILPFSS